MCQVCQQRIENLDLMKNKIKWNNHRCKSRELTSEELFVFVISRTSKESCVFGISSSRYLFVDHIEMHRRSRWTNIVDHISFWIFSWEILSTENQQILIWDFWVIKDRQKSSKIVELIITIRDKSDKIPLSISSFIFIHLHSTSVNEESSIYSQ
jgi:hypothetical protein